MAFSRQVHHKIWIGLIDGFLNGFRIAEINWLQLMPVSMRNAQLVDDLFDRCEVAGIPHLVEVEHNGVALPQ